MVGAERSADKNKTPLSSKRKKSARQINETVDEDHGERAKSRRLYKKNKKDDERSVQVFSRTGITAGQIRQRLGLARRDVSQFLHFQRRYFRHYPVQKR